MRNTILLSLLLGLTWVVGLFPTNTAQEYVFVILNSSMGLYILAYSVVANRQVRGEVRERMSTRVSEMVSTYMNSEDRGTGSFKWYRRNKEYPLKRTSTKSTTHSEK